MLWMTVPYIIGIVIADFWAGAVWPIILASLAVAVACFLFSGLRVAAWVALLFTVGFANQSIQLRHIPTDDLRNLSGEHPQIVTLTGRLATTPEHRVTRVDDTERWRSSVELEVTEIQSDNGVKQGSGTVLVSAPLRLAKRFYAGREIRLTGIFERPPIEQARGMFSYRDTCRGTAFIFSSAQSRCGTGNCWTRRIRRLYHSPFVFSVGRATPWPSRLGRRTIRCVCCGP